MYEVLRRKDREEVRQYRKMPISRVFDLTSDRVREYSLNPREALIAAYEQDRGNWDTWTYKDSMIDITVGRYTYFSGNLSVKK